MQGPFDQIVINRSQEASERETSLIARLPLKPKKIVIDVRAKAFQRAEGGLLDGLQFSMIFLPCCAYSLIDRFSYILENIMYAFSYWHAYYDSLFLKPTPQPSHYLLEQ